MPPTESRSRDEWLVEVRRRGERIRRRRRFTAALVGVLALVMPVTALTTFLGEDRPGNVELTAAGPAPTGRVSAPPDSSVAEPGGVIPPTETASSAPATAGGSAPAGGPEPPTTTAEVHGRVATINGSSAPPQTPASTPPPQATTPFVASVPPADDPVVRPSANSTGTAAGRSASPATADTTVPPADAPVAACPVADIRVAVSTEKDTYGPGEMVEGSSTLEHRSAGPCLVPTSISVEILDGAGKDVFQSSSSYGHSPDPRSPEPGGTMLKAEPGTVFTSHFNWKSSHCDPAPVTTGSSGCDLPFPPGTYTVVVSWGATGVGGGPTVRTTFELSA